MPAALLIALPREVQGPVLEGLALALNGLALVLDSLALVLNSPALALDGPALVLNGLALVLDGLALDLLVLLAFNLPLPKLILASFCPINIKNIIR